MGTFYNPKIITDGLVLHLDAGNKKSYPGSGTTWYDLSKNKNSLNMVNSGSVTYNSSGYFSTGSTGYFYKTGNVNIPTGNSNYTMEVWCRRSSFTTARGIIAIGGFGVNNQSNALRFGDSTNTFRHYWWFNDVQYSFPFVANQWFLVTSLFDGTNRKIYYNGSNLLGTTASSNHNVTSSDVYVGKTYSTEYFQGDIASVKIYNKALSANEVLQNFNATKSRYNL